ncbi:hypothetical protein BH10PSE12_BH10PSE12_32210 [soil metagenome]
MVGCDGGVVTVEVTAPAKRSDLGVRLASGIVMIVFAIAALSLGGAVLVVFVTAIALGVLWEAWGLVRRITGSMAARALWMFALALYAGGAAFGLLHAPRLECWLAIASVVATDTGAYFAGRTVGGPKIAPSISPSKTWAGLLGGMVASALVLCLVIEIRALVIGMDPDLWGREQPDFILSNIVVAVGIGAIAAILAQAGDFFESWMKRRAGVKDSGRLIPGHGGVFDRVDGLLPVACLLGLLVLGRWL